MHTLGLDRKDTVQGNRKGDWRLHRGCHCTALHCTGGYFQLVTRAAVGRMAYVLNTARSAVRQNGPEVDGRGSACGLVLDGSSQVRGPGGFAHPAVRRDTNEVSILQRPSFFITRIDRERVL